MVHATKAFDENRTQEQEAAFIKKLEEQIRVPSDIRKEYNRWEELRRYVHTVGADRWSSNTTTSNFILRTQQSVTANLYPRDPRPKLEPSEWMAIQESSDPQLQEMAVQKPDPTSNYEDPWLNYIQAQEIIIDKQQRGGKLKGAVRGMIQDTQTTPLNWMKVRWIEDYERDPIGYVQEDDFAITVKRYAMLKRLWDDKKFTDNDPDFYEMHDYNSVIKRKLGEGVSQDLADRPAEAATDLAGEEVGEDPRIDELAALTGDELIDVADIPIPPHYQGYVYENIDAEDIRYDWRITRPEDLMKAWWISHRVFMPFSEASERWDLSKEEFEKLRADAALFNSNGSEARITSVDEKAGPEERRRKNNSGNEDATRGKFIAVWEYWDRKSKMVYRWIQGFGKLLDKFQPIAPKRFYPFFPLIFNRVSGKLIGPSDAELLRPLQEEMNLLRTHDREARKSSYPRYMVTKGTLSKGAKRQMRTAAPYSVIEVEKASELAQHIFPLIPATYDPRLYEGSRARQDYEAMSSQSLASIGVTSGASFATSEAIANQQQGIQSDSRRDVILELLSDIYEYMAQMNALRLGADNAKLLAGPGVDWAADALERQMILDNYNMEIEATPNGPAERAQELKMWLDATTMISQLQLPLNRIELAKTLLRLLGQRTNIAKFIDINLLLAMTQAPPEPPGGNGGQPAGGRPDQQGASGADGGRPPTDKNAVASPESVPNRPQLAA